MDPALQLMTQTPPLHPTHPRRRNNKPVSMHGYLSERMSLGEAAKLEMASLPTKTPVSVLQELLSRRGITPKYELVQIEGAIHEPIFRYRVFLSAELVATGTGRSKKEAKHAAAKNLLDLLVGKQSPEQANASNGTTATNDITNQVVSPFDDKVMGNPIGWLQEMCMSRRWPPPSYEMEHEEGLPHERQFTIACQVLKFREVGTGKSKKLAKRMAAHKMWQALQDMPAETANLPQNFEDDDELAARMANLQTRYTGLKDSKIPTLTTPHSHKVSQFHKNLKQSAGQKLQELQTPSCSTTIILERYKKYRRRVFNYISSNNTTDPYAPKISTIKSSDLFNDELPVKETEFKLWENPSDPFASNGTISENCNLVTEDASINDEILLKNPIGFLQEMCMAKFWPMPLYKDVNAEGLQHKRQFKISCQLKAFYVTGCGKIKKLAKWHAAYKMCQKIIELQDTKMWRPLNSADGQRNSSEDLSDYPLENDNIIARELAGCASQNTKNEKPPLLPKMMELSSPSYIPTSFCEDSLSNCGTRHDPNPCGEKTFTNPVGWLQEICVKRFWPFPCYKLVGVQPLISPQWYTVSCQLLTFYEEGIGNSKQLAKHSAAYKMCQKIDRVQVEKTHKTNNLIEQNVEMNDVNSSFDTDDDDKNYIEILKEMADEDGNDVLFIPLNEKTHENNFQCLVKLSVPEIYKCYGEGKTKEAAENNAAKCAIECLKFINNI